MCHNFTPNNTFLPSAIQAQPFLSPKLIFESHSGLLASWQTKRWLTHGMRAPPSLEPQGRVKQAQIVNIVNMYNLIVPGSQTGPQRADLSGQLPNTNLVSYPESSSCPSWLHPLMFLLFFQNEIRTFWAKKGCSSITPLAHPRAIHQMLLPQEEFRVGFILINSRCI